MWYDDNGQVHVDGIFNQYLTAHIARMMTETQFLEEDFDPSIGAVEIDWASLLERLPYEVKDGAYHFQYDGKEIIVDEEFYIHQRWSNMAYRAFDGTIRFECDAFNLWELVAHTPLSKADVFSMTASYCIAERVW